MNNWDMRLPGAEMWGPYLEQSPVSPATFAEDPWEALRSFLPESLPSALHTAASGYAAVLTFLVLGAVIALLLGGHADGTLLDLVCAGGCGVLLWEKLVALSETLCTQIESWNRFLLGFLPVYAGVLTLGGESPFNQIQLSGILCRTPTLRRTPLGREICDIILAVNRRYGRADYLPCIAWGAVAAQAADMRTGQRLTVEGRVQSRVYTKNDNGVLTDRTAYEVSIMRPAEIEEFLVHIPR